MYDILIHDKMAERYFYLLITAFASLILLFSLMAMSSVFPLQKGIAFPYFPIDVVEDYPVIKKLKKHKDEDHDVATMRFLVENYVVARETYDVEQLQRYINSIRQLSSPEIFQAYRNSISPQNPDSPISKYQRHTTRQIRVLRSRVISSPMLGASVPTYVSEVTFESRLSSGSQDSVARYIAEVTYSYNGIRQLPMRGVVSFAGFYPLDFKVTNYQVKRS